MSLLLNADEVLEMAAQIERNGAIFYRTAAKNNPGHEELLLEIARQEDAHLALFETMREDLSALEADPTIFDPDGQGILYLKAMADGHVFDLKNDPADILKGSESIEDVIALAIVAEKDSIAFFVGLKEYVPEVLGSDKIDELIKEEMQHVTWLHEKLEQERNN
jgi:rubrerythrin